MTLSRSLMVFSGNANPALAERVVESLDIQLGKATVTKFSDGEVFSGWPVFYFSPCLQRLACFHVGDLAEHYDYFLRLENGGKRNGDNIVSALAAFSIGGHVCHIPRTGDCKVNLAALGVDFIAHVLGFAPDAALEVRAEYVGAAITSMSGRAEV